MALSDGERDALKIFAAQSLDVADERWTVASVFLDARGREISALRKKALVTPYPGLESIEPERPEVRSYFVLMADMRDSTSHLRSEPPEGASIEDGMHRLYVETFGLLPTLACHIRSRSGRVTEYLGDGVLAFIEAGDIRKSAEFSAAHRLGEECLEICNDVLNELLQDRYGLPSIEIGVGLSVGQAVVTTIGSGEDEKVIAFGPPFTKPQRCPRLATRW
jgi:class 3 adenylate cyclase